MSWEKVIEVLLKIEPVSAIAVIFSVIFMNYCKNIVKSIQKEAKESKEVMSKSHQESLKILKEVIENGKFIKK